MPRGRLVRVMWQPNPRATEPCVIDTREDLNRQHGGTDVDAQEQEVTAVRRVVAELRTSPKRGGYEELLRLTRQGGGSSEYGEEIAHSI